MAGCAGKTVFGVKAVRSGVGTPVRGLGGDRAGDQRGQSRLYGGIACQYCAWTAGEPINNMAISIKSPITAHSRDFFFLYISIPPLT
jgi:hypothetical protein